MNWINDTLQGYSKSARKRITIEKAEISIIAGNVR
jgi:hypothetical protein